MGCSRCAVGTVHTLVWSFGAKRVRTQLSDTHFNFPSVLLLHSLVTSRESKVNRQLFDWFDLVLTVSFHACVGALRSRSSSLSLPRGSTSVPLWLARPLFLHAPLCSAAVCIRRLMHWSDLCWVAGRAWSVWHSDPNRQCWNTGTPQDALWEMFLLLIGISLMSSSFGLQKNLICAFHRLMLAEMTWLPLLLSRYPTVARAISCEWNVKVCNRFLCEPLLGVIRCVYSSFLSRTALPQSLQRS